MNDNLAAAVDDFLAHKRALGRKYLTEEADPAPAAALRRRSMASSTCDQLTPALLDEFVASRPRSRPRSFNHLSGSSAASSTGPSPSSACRSSPLRDPATARPTQRLPFLFDVAQARRLLDAAAALARQPASPAAGRPTAPSSPSATGWGCEPGRRAGCASATSTPTGISSSCGAASSARPASSRTGRASASCSPTSSNAAGPGAAEPDAPLFSFDGRRSVHPGTRQPDVPPTRRRPSTFPVPEGVSPPRLHCLRHSFAVGCLLRWYRDGLDPSTRLLPARPRSWATSTRPPPPST